jgi:hypothetical protein
MKEPINLSDFRMEIAQFDRRRAVANRDPAAASATSQHFLGSQIARI